MIRIRTRSNPRRSSSLSFRVLRTLIFPLLLAGFTDTLAKAVEIEAILGEWERHSKETATARIRFFLVAEPSMVPIAETQAVQSLRQLDEKVSSMSHEAAWEAVCDYVDGIVGRKVSRDRTVEVVERGRDVLNREYLGDRLTRASSVQDGQATHYAPGLRSVVLQGSSREYMYRLSFIRPHPAVEPRWELDRDSDILGRLVLRNVPGSPDPSNASRVEIEHETFLLRWLETPGRYRLRAMYQDFGGIRLPTVGVDIHVAKKAVKLAMAFHVTDGEVNVPIATEELMVSIDGRTDVADFRGDAPLQFHSFEPGEAVALADQRQEKRLRRRQQRGETDAESGMHRHMLLALVALAVAASFVVLKRPSRKGAN